MPLGIALVVFDEIHGGMISLSVPDKMEIPVNTVQQIQISHNFTTSYIITEEKSWNSISFYNEDTEIIIIIRLEKYEEGQDFVQILQEIDEKVAKSDEKNRKEILQDYFVQSFDVFKTRDEVVKKLAEEVASLKMTMHDLQSKINVLLELGDFNTSQKVLISLINVEKRTFEELKLYIKTTDFWLEKALFKLEKKGALKYDKKNDSIYLV